MAELTTAEEYVALVMAGLEDLAAAEIAAAFGVSSERIGVPTKEDNWVDGMKQPVADNPPIFCGLAGVGKLRFVLPRCSGAANEAARREAIAALKAPRCTLALVGVHSGVPFGAEECTKWVAHATVRSNGWAAALQTWRMHRRDLANPPTFRASCVRDGTHEFKSPHVSHAVADAVHELLGLEAAMVNFDLEVVALVLQHELVTCLFNSNLVIQFRLFKAFPDAPSHADTAVRIAPGPWPLSLQREPGLPCWTVTCRT